MKCLMKYQWVKLPRNHLPEGKGVMGAWAKLAARAAFRKGQASYCGHINAVRPGMWSGGVVGLKSITFDENGLATVSTDLPFGSYYVKERSTDVHYILSDAKYGFEFTYESQETAVVELTVNNGAAIENKLKYLEAANNGNEGAMCSLCEIYKNNAQEIPFDEANSSKQKLFHDNLELSFKWGKKAADLGDEEAAYLIGVAYFSGLGVAENKNEAEKYLQFSAKNGNADAKQFLTEHF